MNETHDNTSEMLKKLKLGVYRNSTEVCHINGRGLTIEDLMKAGVISGSNILLLGESGGGKTQLATDILYSWFGGRGTHIRVTPDLDLKGLYQRINLAKLAEAKTTDEIREITDMIKNPVTVIDEITRAPPVVQNQLMNICDGYVEIWGKKYSIGYKNYSIGIGTANIGDEYRGTFYMDDALRQRFHLIIDMDNFYPNPTDTYEILIENCEPRIIEGEVEDHTDDIISLWHQVNERKTPLTAYIVDLYLVYGLDYIDGKYKSKRKQKLFPYEPTFDEGSHESASFLGIIKPISQRTLKSLLRLYNALEMVAESKGAPTKPEYHLSNFLEVAKVVLPCLGVLDSSKVENLYYGNPYEAMKDVTAWIEKVFREKENDIIGAISEARKGELTQDSLDKFQGDSYFMRGLLRKLNESS